jgi:hypothetical protein
VRGLKNTGANNALMSLRMPPKKILMVLSALKKQ